ncbi:MAG: hypothetical protein FD180_3011 [Planctomycetota bacterium]|nr:MAG: hypothetical protein FD180_3011 [Planctomycetota bacterium]
MTRIIFTLPLAFALALPAAADPDKSGSGSVSGGASDSAGDAAKGEGHCPGNDKRADEPVDDEMPNHPMLWTFSSPKQSFLEAVCKLFKKFPGEVKLGEIKKVKGDYVMEVRTQGKSLKDHEKFSDWFMEKASDRREDHSWGCQPDDERMKEMEKARAREENQEEDAGKREKKDAGKPAESDQDSCPEPKK